MPVAEPDQVRDGALGRGHVVDRHMRDVELVAAHGHDRHSLFAQPLHGLRHGQGGGGVAQLAADEHHARRLLAVQHGEVGLELAGVAVVVADQHHQAVGDGGVLQAAHDDAEERVGDVVHDRPDDLAAAGDEGAGGGVGDVVEGAGGLFDALPGTLADRIGRAGEHARGSAR